MQPALKQQPRCQAVRRARRARHQGDAIGAEHAAAGGPRTAQARAGPVTVCSRTVHDLYNIFVCVLLQDLVVHAHLAEFVLDDGKPQAVVGALQDMIQQSRLPSPEEASQNCHRDSPVGVGR